MGFWSNRNKNTANTSVVNPSANTANTANTSVVSPPANTKISFKQGAGYFVGGLVFGVIAFLVAYWCIQHFFDIHYVLTSVFALIFAALTIKAWDKANGEVPTPMSGPLTYFLIIIFIISLLYGYQNDKKNNKDSGAAKSLIIESGTLRSAGDVWFTNKIFETGSTVEIEVTGNNVKIVDGNTLFPGTHRKSITSNGKLAFIGMQGPSTIKVTYR